MKVVEGFVFEEQDSRTASWGLLYIFFCFKYGDCRERERERDRKRERERERHFGQHVTRV